MGRMSNCKSSLSGFNFKFLKTVGRKEKCLNCSTRTSRKIEKKVPF